VVNENDHTAIIAYSTIDPLSQTPKGQMMQIDDIGLVMWGRNYSNFTAPFGSQAFDLIAGPSSSYIMSSMKIESSWSNSALTKTESDGSLGNCDCFEDLIPDRIPVNSIQLTADAEANSSVCDVIEDIVQAEDIDQELEYCDRTLPPSLNLCEEAICLTDSFILNTGVDHFNGQLLSYGTYDPFWRFVSGPIPGLSSHPAYVVEPNTAWAELFPSAVEANYLSFLPYDEFTENNPEPAEPYIFENCFCVCEDSSEVTIELTLSADDYAEVFLCDEDGVLIDTILIADTLGGTYAFQEPLNSDTLVTILDEGTYCIKVELRNLGAVAMGFAAVGTVKGGSIISELCCNNGSSIVGSKYHDLNCDGERGSPNDPNAPEHELGLPGWGIVLCDSVGNPIDTTYTDTLGYYSFEFLLPGKYRVKELLQPGWEATAPLSPDYWEVMLDTLEVEGFVDFGNKYTGPLVFRDSIECAKRGSENAITWEGGDCDCPVNIDVVNCETGAIINLATGVANHGVFYWNVPVGFPIGDYRIVITNCDGSDMLESECFPIRDCCCDERGFNSDVSAGFNLEQSCDGIIVTPRANDDCYVYYWQWDTGLPYDGPYPPGTTVSYDYVTPGAYTVCMKIEEYDDFGELCREGERCELISFGCPPACDSLDVFATPVDTTNNQCCWSLSYTNTFPDSVYGIEIVLSGGATLVYDNDTDIAAPFKRFNFSGQSILLIEENLNALPAGSITDFFNFCIAGVDQQPQLVTINWYDANFNIVCDEILLFDCEPEQEECLYILTDTLVCDTAGYKYIATVKNPQGSGFDVGRIKLNVLNPTTGIMVMDSIIDLTPPLAIGDTMMIMFVIETNEDLFGEDFCFLLSAHDGPDEMLCCAEIEKCIPFPECNSCENVDVMAMPIDPINEDSCCYTFTIKNGYNVPGYFTNIEMNMLTEGVYFSVTDLPMPPAWWYDEIETGTHYLWSHFSGSIPIDTVDVFDFCIDGVTTTDSVYIEVNWLREDSIVCYDTLALYCPECVEITQDTVECLPDGTYKYTFNFTNLNDQGLPVNAIRFIDDLGYIVDPPAGDYLLLPTPVPYGQTSTFDPMIVIDAPDSVETFCFTMVMTYLNEDSVNVECCYVEHCIELPGCGEPCPQFSCIPPPNLEFGCGDLPDDFDPNNLALLQILFGEPTVEGDCPGLSWQELPPLFDFDDCGGGFITRFFEAVDGAGNTNGDNCTQDIFIFETHRYEMRFPQDVDVLCTDIPAPDNVVIGSGACDLVAQTFQDEIFDNDVNGCFSILRTYQIVNFCIHDGVSPPKVIGRDEDCDGLPGDEDVFVIVQPDGTVYIDRDEDPFNNIPAAGTKLPSCDGLTNNAGYWLNSLESPLAVPPRDLSDVGIWEYTQVINVTDNLPPVIIPDTASTFCSFDNVNCEGDVNYQFTIQENCLTDQLAIIAALDLDADGNADIDVTALITGTYPDYEIATTVPIGTHQFIVIVGDQCGNEATYFLPFEVVDCTPPDIVCLSSATIALAAVVPPSDVDGDGTIDLASATIAAADLVEGLTFDCTGQGPNGEVTLFSINPVGEPANPSQTSLILTCDDVGVLNVEIYAYDDAGNSNLCISSLTIVDFSGECGPVSPSPVPNQLISYPNPTSDIIYLLPPASGKYELEGMDARGVSIVERNVYFDGQTPVAINASNWEDGMYIFRLKDKEGGYLETKVIKIH
jgi:hypothetical protein